MGNINSIVDIHQFILRLIITHKSCIMKANKNNQGIQQISNQQIHKDQISANINWYKRLFKQVKVKYKTQRKQQVRKMSHQNHCKFHNIKRQKQKVNSNFINDKRFNLLQQINLNNSILNYKLFRINPLNILNTLLLFCIQILLSSKKNLIIQYSVHMIYYKCDLTYFKATNTYKSCGSGCCYGISICSNNSSNCGIFSNGQIFLIVFASIISLILLFACIMGIWQSCHKKAQNQQPNQQQNERQNEQKNNGAKAVKNFNEVEVIIQSEILEQQNKNDNKNLISANAAYLIQRQKPYNSLCYYPTIGKQETIKK